MTGLTEHDQRQIERMAERLEQFEKGDISLRVLIADLEFLVGALQSVEATIREQLRDKWEVLEEVYSVAVGMRGGKLDDHAESLIRDAVAALRVQAATLLESPTTSEL
jgi:hypothetical protein